MHCCRQVYLPDAAPKLGITRISGILFARERVWLPPAGRGQRLGVGAFVGGACPLAVPVLQGGNLFETPSGGPL